MNRNDRVWNNLNLLLKMFKNRPYHLSKYLLDNNALTLDFLNKIEKSDKLKEFGESDDTKFNNIYHTDISKMDEFFTSLLESDEKKKTLEEITQELNFKLQECIINEQYEDAARIRDYMRRKGIKKI